MAAFKKGFLVLAVVLLALAGASGTAYAQHPFGGLVQCTAGSTPTIVRAEGIAEILGDIVLVCTSTAPTALSATVITNFNVTLNTNVTNNNFDGASATGNAGGSNVSDAVLIVNEVSAFTASGLCSPSGTPTSDPLAIAVPTTKGTPPVSGTYASQCPQYGRRLGNNTLSWNGVLVPAPDVGLNPPVTTIRMTNVRGNASIFAAGDLTFPSAQLTAVVSVTGTTNLTVTSNVLNVGSPLRGLDLRFRGRGQTDPSDDPTTRIPIGLQQCVDSCINRDGDFIGDCLPTHTTGSGPNDPFFNATTLSVRLSEGFATAFKTLGAPTDLPGLTQWEDGYLTPNSGINNGGATQGTRFILKFFNVPAGIRIFTPVGVGGTSSSIGAVAHRLTIVKVGEVDLSGSGSGGIVGIGVAEASREVPISGGFGFTVYEVIDDNPFIVENLVIPVVLAYRADTANDRPAVGTISMSVNFAPLSTTVTSSRSAPEPRFVETNTPRAVGAVARCITNVLYPFVTNRFGFDTGFSLANTSADDKGTVNQAGTCTLFYFGDTTGGGAAPSQQTSCVVGAGKTITWTLSGGNEACNIKGTPGFQGYIFARCDFQFAHGFAFITDGFGGVPTLAEGYLALVVPWNGVNGDRGLVTGARLGEALGH